MHPDKASQTAARVALARAIEARRPQRRRICSDDHAGHFIDDSMRPVLDSWWRRKLFNIISDIKMPGVIGSVLARTRFIDELLCKETEDGIDQVVILGAGYDTRSFRFQKRLQDVPVFEVDHPATQTRKTALIRSAVGTMPPNVILVPVRFDSEDFGAELEASGYQTTGRTFFIWEGVTYYLSGEAAGNTLKFVAAHSAAGSSIVFDYFPPSVIDGTCRLKEAVAMRRRFAQFGEHFSFGIAPERIQDFLSTKGFEIVRNLTPADIEQQYGRAGFRQRKVSGIFHFVSARVMPKHIRQPLNIQGG